jgi:hypothetical protein
MAKGKKEMLHRKQKIEKYEPTTNRVVSCAIDGNNNSQEPRKIWEKKSDDAATHTRQSTI